MTLQKKRNKNKMLKNKKEIPKEWKDYQKFLKETSQKTCFCLNCKLFRFILKNFSKKELTNCLKNFVLDHSSNYQKFPSYIQ